MSKKHKSEKEQELMASLKREEVINNALKFSKKRFKKFDEVIQQLYLKEDLSDFFSDRRIAKIHECFTKVATKTKTAERALLKEILIYLDKYSLLVSEESFIQAVFNMLQFRAYWRNNILKWKPSSNNGRVQVKELASCLFCKYEVPEFLYSSFFEQKNTLCIQWFIHIGMGRKVRDLAKMPIPFTQKMGHYFLQAPSKFSIIEALRWAQVKGLNGSDRLAERIAFSWIGTKTFEDEGFWEAFIRVIANGGMFNYDMLTELIDFVRESKRQNRNYSLKGRTLQSLMRQCDEWHKHTILTRGHQYWPSSDLSGYKVEKKQEIIKIEELTGSKLLVAEGNAMKHCVASYAHQCVKGKTAIFSLRKYSFDFLTEILATIEVNLSLKRIVQAKAKMNKQISDEARKHLEFWANKNELEINPYL